MGSIETEQNPQSQSHPPRFPLDCLYCEEKYRDNDDHDDKGISSHSDVFALEFDVSSPEEDEDQLLALFSKEERLITHFNHGGELDARSSSLMLARTDSLDWMTRVSAHHGFSANTLVLGANYFDRFMLSFGARTELPWMAQLAATACVSLASKIEETRLPRPHLLLDYQVDCKHIFEAKTIQRMELLVLSTLEWKMNAVTPLSFFGHLIKRLKLKTHLHWQILCRFQTLILSAIMDPRILCYFPSVLAAATLVQALRELGLWSSLEHETQLMDLFKISEDKVTECHKFIQELSSNHRTQKRKYASSTSASSPDNVLDVLVNDISRDSSISSLLSSPERLLKKR